jgi:hypothetical protein
MSGKSTASKRTLDEIGSAWMRAWPRALEAWSKFTRLKLPMLCLTTTEARDEGLTGSFAMIRLTDQAIVVSLPEVVASGVEDYAVEILAHEIGHHVLAPATLTDHARTIARIRWALPTIEKHAPMVANLYTDLLINDRLQRSAGLRIAEVYKAISHEVKSSGAVWTLYLRIYEILWRLDRGSLLGGQTNDRIEGDAWLGARLIRSFARDWLNGAGRFASLLLPHLLEDDKSAEVIARWQDTRNAAVGGNPGGLIDEDGDERSGAIHPSQDPELNGEGGKALTEQESPNPVDEHKPSHGQTREPYQFGELLRAVGIDLTDHEVAVRYYRERALPHLIPFPSRRLPESVDPLPEGLEPWDIGHPLDEVDWFQSALQSPVMIPGMTTVQRVWGASPGNQPETVPLDLDLYVDCSGSMPNPQRLTSFLALAGAIVSMSALRAGARVQATLWSGVNQVTCTDGFVRDETAILRTLTGFFGGGTAFPIHVLRDTYQKRQAGMRPTHILVISDDGISTMFDRDEQGNSGWEVSAMALSRAGGGGTFVLNLMADWDAARQASPIFQSIKRARDIQGWNVHRVASWDDLVVFAREFSRLRYGEPSRVAQRSGNRSPAAKGAES